MHRRHEDKLCIGKASDMLEVYGFAGLGKHYLSYTDSDKEDSLNSILCLFVCFVVCTALSGKLRSFLHI